MRNRDYSWRSTIPLLLLALAPSALLAANPPPRILIHRVDRPPVLEDFLEMKPNGEMDGKLAKISDFIQREPVDGAPSTQRTEAYLGYEDKNFCCALGSVR